MKYTIQKIVASIVIFISVINIGVIAAENQSIKIQHNTLNLDNENVVGELLKTKKTHLGKIKDGLIYWQKIKEIKYVSNINTKAQFIAKGRIYKLIPLDDLEKIKNKKQKDSIKNKNTGKESEKNINSQEALIIKSLKKGIDLQGITDNIVTVFKGKQGDLINNEPITIYYDSIKDEYYFIGADDSINYIPRESADILIDSGRATYYNAVEDEDPVIGDDAVVYYFDTDGNRYTLDENGNKTYYTADGETYTIDENGVKTYYTADGETYTIDENGVKTYYTADGETYTIDENGVKTYYTADGESYTIDENGVKVFFDNEDQDTYSQDIQNFGFSGNNDDDLDLGGQSYQFTPNPDPITGPPSSVGSNPITGSPNPNPNPITGSPSPTPVTGPPSPSGSNPITGSPNLPDPKPSEPKILSKTLEITCSVELNTAQTNINVKYRTEKTYTNGARETTDCNKTASYPIIKNFDRCDLRHDFHTKKSYKQAELFYYNKEGSKIAVRNCSDTSVVYNHLSIQDNCPNYFNSEDRMLYLQKKAYIVNEGRIQIISDCFIEAANSRQLSNQQELKEYQQTEKINFDEKKAYQTYRKYFLINGDFHYTSEVLVDENNFYPITKEYGSCQYEHRPTANISYKQFRWAYKKDNGNPISITQCAIDESLNYAHITDTLFCIPVYINQRIFERQQTYFRDNNDSIVVVAPCSPTQRELAQDPAKIVKDFSGCLPMIDYHNMRVTPQYKDTYPIGGNFVIVSDCKQSTSFYPLTTTAESCPANIDFTQKIVTPTVRFTYSDGDDTFFVGECQQVSGQTTLVLNEETAGCVMRLNADRKLLKVYAQKFYINQDGESVNVGGCEFNGETKELTPYFVKDYSVCAMTVNSDFTVGSRNFKQLLQIPNGPIHTIQNCRPDTAQTVNLLKDFTACAPNIDIATNSVTLRAKIYYVDENGDEQIFNNCATTQEQITLIKDYGNCNPNQKFINGKVHRYYQYKYTKYSSSENEESVYPFNQCSLEATGSSNLIDDFTCIDGEFDKIIDAGGKPQINAKGNRNNLSFTTYAEEGYALINAKKIFKDNSQKWQVAEPCSPRIEYGSFIIKSKFKGYEFYDNLKHQKVKYQDHFEANMQRVFEKATEINTGIAGVQPEALSYSLAAMPATIDVAIDNTERINDFPIPYVFLSSKKYNKSALRGSITTTKGVEVENRFPIILENSNTINIDGARTVIEHQLKTRTTSEERESGTKCPAWANGSCKNDQRIPKWVTYIDYFRHYETKKTVYHKIIEIEKWQRNDNRRIYYKIDEYETAKENARKDLEQDNINYETLIDI